MDDLIDYHLRNAIERREDGTLVTEINDGIRVITPPRDAFSGAVVSYIEGGPLDGDHFTAWREIVQDEHHACTVRLVEIRLNWRPRRKGRGR